MPPLPGYRIFVGAFPQGEMAQRIQITRERYDRVTARITAPHVTMVGTYSRSGPPTVENETATITLLEEVARTLPSFDLILGGVRTFPPADKPVIYLAVEPTAELLSIRRALLEAIGPDKHSRRFTPHLTLAMRLSAAAAGMMLDDLRDGEWDTAHCAAPIHALSLMQRGPLDNAWREIGKAGLK